MSERLPETALRAPWASRRLRAPLALIAMLCLGLSSTACRSLSRSQGVVPGSEPTDASAAWPVALLAAQSNVDLGRHADADKVLREFAGEYARTPEARETGYWRAVFMLDPLNTTATPKDAAAMLDRYLASNGPLLHRAEATVLQRVAKTLATPPREAPAREQPVVAAPPRADPAREAEMKALRDELEQTKAELERIKKRLATPPTTAPPPLADAK